MANLLVLSEKMAPSTSSINLLPARGWQGGMFSDSAGNLFRAVFILIQVLLLHLFNHSLSVRLSAYLGPGRSRKGYGC